jgi:DNA-binding NtrC family response regulator
VSSRPLSTRLLERDPGQLDIDEAELRVATGPDRGLTSPLGAESVRIGTAGDCELVLHDETVSARHAEILTTRRGVYVRDLGSKNGVRIGNIWVERAPVRSGMTLRLGKTSIAVRSLGRVQSVPLARPGLFGGLTAHSIQMRAVVATLERLALHDTAILLEGETGAGKEVAAQAIHSHSARAAGPFVVVDCGGLVASLAAAELFGSERGAYTGASESRAGLLEEADGGTLFLDEVGELPLDVQRLLVRSLDARVVRRIGGAEDRPCDARVVAATHRNLGEEVKQGRFRQDLYFRLNVARVRIPPLRERPEDIPYIARGLADEIGIDLPPQLMTALLAYEWPGNVRELRNCVARAAAPLEAIPLASEGGRVLRPDPLRQDGRLLPLSEARRRALDAIERAYLEEAMALASFSPQRVAELAGVSRQLITRLLARHSLRLRDRRNPE